MVQGIFIPSNNELPVEERAFHNPDDYTAAIGGSSLTIDVPHGGVSLITSRAGAGDGLPDNARATFMWWLWFRDTEARARTVRGDVVLVGLPDRKGVHTNVPDELLEAIARPHQFRLDIQTRGKWHANPVRFPDYFLAAGAAVGLPSSSSEIEQILIIPVDETLGEA